MMIQAQVIIKASERSSARGSKVQNMCQETVSRIGRRYVEARHSVNRNPPAVSVLPPAAQRLHTLLTGRTGNRQRNLLASNSAANVVNNERRRKQYAIPRNFIVRFVHCLSHRRLFARGRRPSGSARRRFEGCDHSARSSSPKEPMEKRTFLRELSNSTGGDRGFGQASSDAARSSVAPPGGGEE